MYWDIFIYTTYIDIYIYICSCPNMQPRNSYNLYNHMWKWYEMIINHRNLGTSSGLVISHSPRSPGQSTGCPEDDSGYVFPFRSCWETRVSIGGSTHVWNQTVEWCRMGVFTMNWGWDYSYVGIRKRLCMSEVVLTCFEHLPISCSIVFNKSKKQQFLWVCLICLWRDMEDWWKCANWSSLREVTRHGL